MNLKRVLAPPEQPRCVIDAIAFKVDTEIWPQPQLPGSPQQTLLAYALDINEYRGRSSPPLRVSHLEPVL